MYGQVKRSETYIAKLKDFITKTYVINIKSITPAKRGFYGETWRLDAIDHSYFLKLVYLTEHQSTFENSFPVMEHLCKHGIDFISQIIKTTDGSLFTHFDGAVLGLFDWIDGENIETNETKIPEFQMLAKVYTVPPDGLQILNEDFSGKSAGEFFEQWKITIDKRINSLLEKNRVALEYRAERLDFFAYLCRSDKTGFFITHGDAGGNFVANNDKHFIVDWDGAILAPPERDVWVMGFQKWARNLFQNTLRDNGIEYTLRPERLAYYCYYMFFYWLTWLTKCSPIEEIEDFFNGYGEARIEYADKLYRQIY